MAKIYLGSHVSMRGPSYYLGSVEEAIKDGATTLMLYTGAPQNSVRTPLEKLKIEEAITLAKENNFDLSKFVCHAPYLINLANTLNASIHNMSKEMLANELIRTHAMGIKILVLHPGSHVKAGAEVGLDALILGLDDVLENDHTDVTIALETMPGGGSQVGGTFEEIKQIIERSKFPHRLGVCLDTCHLYSAGIDVKNVDQTLDLIEASFGLDRVKCIHLNDSQFPMHSHKDRHANLGQGVLGFETLYNWVHHPRLSGVPFILETPYINEKSPYKAEIEMLLSGEYDPDWTIKL